MLGQGSLGQDLDAEEHFVTAGGTHAIFSSEAHIEPTAPPAGTRAIYDRVAGSSNAQVLSLLPGEITPDADQHATFLGATEDGSVVAFKLNGAIYVRRDGEVTVKVTDGPASFAGLSSDGKRAFYVDAVFTEGTGIQPAGLFSFDLDTQIATEIAPQAAFVNVSDDGSRVYFTSQQNLGDAPLPADLSDKLYLWDGSQITHVATLDPDDFVSFPASLGRRINSWITAITAEPQPQLVFGRAHSPTRSTPGGKVLVFESHAQLTTYENEGKAEVYRYEAATDSLVCVSCDPTGAPPGGDATLQTAHVSNGTALIPNVTDDGQAVFFQSHDPLLPEDANAVTDVYEWKAQGTGGCERTGGCLALISSGQSDEDSYLYGMSADGRDVFFSTTEKLHGKDIAGSSSIYDARIEGGIPDPPQPAPCQGDACQGPGTTPAPLPTPASTGTSGEGNARPGTNAPCGRTARAARRQSNRAKHLRRAARRAEGHRAHNIRRQAGRSARKARRLARGAKRCRARQRQRANANRRDAR